MATLHFLTLDSAHPAHKLLSVHELESATTPLVREAPPGAI